MRYILIICAVVTLLFGCAEQPKTTSNSTSPAPTSPISAFELKVTKWGPDVTKLGVVPNKQPDGSMGIWIEIDSTDGLGEAQVLFDGKPAKVTSVQQKMITAAIVADELSILGNKDVSIKQLSTGKVFPVGSFKVLSPK